MQEFLAVAVGGGRRGPQRGQVGGDGEDLGALVRAEPDGPGGCAPVQLGSGILGGSQDWPTRRAPAGRACSPPASWPGSRPSRARCPPRAQRPWPRWTCPELARHAAASGIAPAPSASTVRRWLADDALKPWQHRSWIFPRNPHFALKASRALDLYQREWEGEPLGEDEYVLSADEKPGVQARMRIHLPLPPGPGRPMRAESEYHRFGTLAYLAAYDVAVGALQRHHRDVVSLGEGGHPAAEGIPDLLQARRRRDRVPAVQIEPVQALQVQRDMTIQHVIDRDRHRPREPRHHGNLRNMAYARRMRSPAPLCPRNHKPRRYQAEPVWTTYSKGSVVIGGQGRHDGQAGVVVVPDRVGQGQDALQDADGHPCRGVPAVAFQV